MESPEIRRSLFDSEESMGWTYVDLELVLKDKFEPADFHISRLLLSFLAGHVYKFVYLL